MFQTQKNYIRADHKIASLIYDNPTLLLPMEHLGLSIIDNNQTVEQTCASNSVNLKVFLVFCNLYNGYLPTENDMDGLGDIPLIIRFLRNGHKYYKLDRYPKIKGYIHRMHEMRKTDNIVLIEKFFDDYFEEVLEHLNYEDEVAFPYFLYLIGSEAAAPSSIFSVNEYREHHTDIETKLNDLKSLLIRHIPFRDDLALRRKFILSLSELEFELNIHSLIEEKILLPMLEKLENKKLHG
jgi:regulator of cell morphogenesis and NO signaling